MSDYNLQRPRKLGPPKPERSGLWWRSSWIIRVARSGALEVPAPPAELDDVRCLVVVLALTERDLRMDMFHHQEVLKWSEFAYASVVLRSIDRALGIATVDGEEHHPILRLVNDAG
jgi:hypothetical protein